MQNLRNVDQHILGFPDKSTLSAAAWDLSDDSLICAFGPTKDDDLLSLKRFRPGSSKHDDLELIAAWDAKSPHPDLSHDSIVDLHHFSDSRTIVLVLEGGDIVVVREEISTGEDAVEIVGSVDDGIAAAAWSPDEELVLLATKSSSLLLMTRQFDSTATVTLSVDDLKVSNHVSVGWGKVETQFKGRGARALRDPTIPEHIDSGILSDYDDGRVSISWRGDGECVAVNSILETQPYRRVLRMLSREGILESVSEAVDGMDSALTWKPSGQTIASVRRLGDKAQVIFFERNGLRHGEFDLRLTSQELQAIKSITLQWNVDSSVLAVVLDHKVQLWSTGNYHWYLKQEIKVDIDQKLRNHSVWHPEKTLHLACFTARSLLTAQYTSCYTTGPTSAPHDDGLVATIDGNRLAITPLRIANVPPPMAYDDLALQDVAIDVFVHPWGKSIAVLHHEQVSMYEYDYDTKPAKKARLTSTFKLKTVDSHRGVLPRQVVVDGDSVVTVLASASTTSGALLARWQGQGPDAAYELMPHQVTSCFTDIGTSTTILHESQGDLLCIPRQKDMLLHGNTQPQPLRSISTSCLDAQVWHVDGHIIAVGRTASGQLHIHSDTQHLKVSGCTSFTLTSSHLIFTTTQHLLKFVHLHGDQLEIPSDEPEKDERCRNVERGAKIVTAIPRSYALILQMPRGNLETIYPRAMVLAGIRKNVLDKQYKKAFMTCRSQRVDMNILCDYAPEQLLADVNLFIKQLGKVEYIDLFLSSLVEEDVTKTIYKETAVRSIHTAGVDTSVITGQHVSGKSKVNTVCDALLAALRSLGPAYLQCVITAHVSKHPPDLEAGLQLISQLRAQGNEKDVEQAVDHICFLGDVNRLYDTALGMYDLEVTLLVAQQSQKDPREYLPYLQGLRDMGADRRRFTIDNDLKRYTKALHSLCVLDVFDELQRYVERHELYAEAVELYRHDKARLHQLMRIHAEFLSSRNRYSDAGVAFEFVGDYRPAFEAYRAAGMWRETLTVAARIPIEQTEQHELAQALSDGLYEAKDYVSAAIIQLDYLDDLPGAVKLQCKAYNFDEGMRLAALRGSTKLLELVVDPGLVECSGLMTELLAEMKTQLNSQIPRLRDLRKKKLEEPMAFLDAGETEDGDFPDNLSVAPTDASTSGGTFMTRYTNRSTSTLATNATKRTSRNRRREERKRARGKKGTVYEEEYLVNSITRLIERLNETGRDLTKLVQGLMRRAMRERAFAVQKAMVEVEQLCREHMDEVYEIAPVQPEVVDQEAVLEERRPVGGQGVLWDSLTSTQKKPAAPSLKAFERLSLLSG